MVDVQQRNLRRELEADLPQADEIANELLTVFKKEYHIEYRLKEGDDFI
jgi:hypothetical protein